METTIRIMIPQNIEAEKSYLGSILLDNTIIHSCPLSPEMFYSELNKKIFTEMQRLETIDVILLANQNIDKNYLLELINNVPTSANAKQYANEIKNCYGRKLAMTFFEEAQKRLQSNEDTTKILNWLKSKLIGVNTNKKYDVEENPQMANDWYDNYDKPRPIIKTGIGTIDRLMGGFGETDLGLVLANTNIGKTTLLLNMAIKMAQAEKKVLFYSLEMTATQLQDKLISIIGKHNAYEISIRQTKKEEISDTVIEFSKLPIIIVHRGAITSQDVISETYNRKLQDKVDIVLLDYAQRLTDDSKESEVIRMGTIARNLKNFALTNSIPIITPAQVDKASSKNKKYEVENVAWAKAFADEADVALYLYEKELEDKTQGLTTNYEIEKELRLRVVKSRFSRKGTDIKIDFDKTTLEMKDAVSEEKQKEENETKQIADSFYDDS